MLLNLALNHMTFPNSTLEELLELAVASGCVGIEVRNDLGGDIFSGLSPQQARKLAEARGIRLLALAQLNEFNVLSDSKVTETAHLIRTVVDCGAESLCLIPRNDGSDTQLPVRRHNLKSSLSELKPMLKEAGIVGMVEPLGFATSSLQSKAEVVEVIDEVDGNDCFKLVHDTFHHHLAGSGAMFSQQTGMVHISGVADNTVAVSEMTDAHRGFVDADDRLENVSQLQSLIEAGYNGPVSMEVFSPDVHRSSHAAQRLRDSFNYIVSAVTPDVATA